MKNLIFVSLFLLVTVSTHAKDYLQTIPLSGSECLGAITALNSGELVAAGVDFTSSDILLMKLSAAGTVLKTQRLSGSGAEEAQAVTPTSDGGAVVVGSTNSFGEGNTDAFIMKVRRAGTVAWRRTFGTSGNEHFVKIVQTSDRGFIVLGDADHDPNLNDIVVAKFSARGRPVWRKVISAGDFDHASGLTLTADQGVLVVIAADFPEGTRSVLVKIGPTGSIEWSRIYGTSGNHLGLSAIQTEEGDYYFTEVYSSGSQKSGTVLSKLDSNGVPLWSKIFKSRGVNLAASVHAIPANAGLLLSGNTTSTGGASSQGILIGLDQNGRILWRKKVRPDVRPAFLGAPHVLTSDGSILVAGCSGDRTTNDLDSLVLKAQSNGNIQGGCSKLTSFPLSGKRFSLISSAFVVDVIEVPFFTASAGFQTTTVSGSESPVCSSE